MSLDLHSQYGLRRVINACGKMTHLSGAIVLPEIAEVASESLRQFFFLEELHALASRVIAANTGSEAGCVTACSAAGITLSVAAAMTGPDLGRVLQLPDTEGMPNRVVLQKGHTVNYGQPITQAVRLAGARPVEAGSVNSCSEAELVHALRTPGAAALLAVESHHTVRHGYVPLPRAVELAHQAGVPVIVDGAAQDLRLRELIGLGCDLVITSAHKYLCSTTGGVVAGRSELVRAVLLQNRGIGRGMKAGKEAILGAVAALEYRAGQDLEGWTAEQDRKVARILALLEGIPGLQLSVDPDPNGCPFSRARLTLDEHPSHTAVSLARALAEGDPAVVPRAHHAVEGYLHLDAIEMTEAELEYACARVRRLLT